jgi:protein involved in ribonucleotide reduction
MTYQNMTNNARHFVKKLLICKHNKANDNLIHGNQYILVNIINICISGEYLLLESEMVEYVKWSDK